MCDDLLKRGKEPQQDMLCRDLLLQGPVLRGDSLGRHEDTVLMGASSRCWWACQSLCGCHS